MVSIRKDDDYYCIYLEDEEDYFLFGLIIKGDSLVNFAIYQYQTEKYGSSINIDNYKHINLLMKDLTEIETLFEFGKIKTKILNYIKKNKKNKEFIDQNFNDIRILKIFETILKGDAYVKTNQ